MTIAFDLKIHFLKTTEEQTLFCTYPTYGIDPIINLSSNMYLMNEKKNNNNKKIKLCNCLRIISFFNMPIEAQQCLCKIKTNRVRKHEITT